jgi:hypothetical protein
MSWVEDLKPDDDVTVEIIYPPEYIKYCMSTIKKFTSGVATLCKGAAILGDDDTEFLVYGMTVLQVITIEEIMRHFGIEMEHDMGKLSDGTRWTYFYCDIRGLREMLENGELEGKADM